MSPRRSRIVGLVPLLIGLAAWCLPRSSFAAITVDAPNVSNATANAASLTWSHTVGAGANRILVVGISLRGSATITGVTYGGTSLVPIGSHSSNQVTSALWYLLAPPQGTASVVVTFSASASAVGGAVTFFGVDQTTPLGTYVSATGSSTTASVPATSAAGELVIDTVAANGNAGTLAAAGGQAELWNAGPGTAPTDVRGGGSTKPGAASVVMSWTLGASRRWVIGAVPLRPVPLSGHVFEDVNYGGGAGRDKASASGVPLPGARVELYDGAGNFASFTTTDASGNYSFSGIAAGNYTVRAVDSSVISSRAGYVVGLLSVQTYRTNASGGTAIAVTDHVGGQDPAVADAGSGSAGTTMDTTTGVFTAGISGTAQSIANVAIGTPGVSDVDFGFNFNTIVNVNDSGQGSLRQFLLNSNALGNAGLAIAGQPAGKDVSVFMISDGQAHAGLHVGIANLLTGGVGSRVAVIAPVTDLDAIMAADTSVDGTTQTANVGNTNAVVLGTGGAVGVDGLVLSTVEGPEVEIVGNPGTSAKGLLIQAANAVVRGLAIHGFGTVDGQAGVRVDAFPNALIENCVLGSRATSFTDPGSAQRNQAGVYSNGGSNSTVRNNLIGFGRVTGVFLAAGTAGWTITGNEIRDSGMDTANGDGININASPTNTSSGNLVTGASSQGIIVTAAGATGNVFTNNTVTGNGVGISSGLVQSMAICLRPGASSTLLDRNVIRANYGAGVQANDGSTGTRMTRNSFSLNGTITSRNGGAATGQIGIDLNSPSDNVDVGTAPFYTPNDAGDTDTGGNGRLNFPVLVWANMAGGNLSIGGYARAGSVIELFVASPDPTGFGEGTTYGITLTEGGTGAGGNDSHPDTDAGTGTYGPGPVNGVAQGTDTTSRFAFFLPAPGGVSVGTRLTATATLGGETSEFGGNVTVAAATAVALMSLEAAPSGCAVDLSWRTGSELGNLGFHLYRGLSAGGPWTRLNSSLIPGLDFSATGAAYAWHDGGLQNGVLYFYRLEDVDARSVSTLHGPISASPRPCATPAPPGSSDSGGSGSGSGGGASSSTCPSWALNQLDSPASYTCETHGSPAASFRVLSRTTHTAVVELDTAGFLTARDATGRVRALLPDFDSLSDPRAPALPLKRARLEGIVGREARIESIQARENRVFTGLVAAAVGYPQTVVAADGTVRPGRRRAELGFSRGVFPQVQARLAGEGFQGEDKTVTLELMPLRYDASRGALVLSRRLTVRLDFTRVRPSEVGRGRFGRHVPRPRTDPSALAFLATSQKGLHAVAFETVFPGRSRPLDPAALKLTRRALPAGTADSSSPATDAAPRSDNVPFFVLPKSSSFGPGSRLYFYVDATASSTSFSPEVVYALESGTGGIQMALGDAFPDGSAGVTSRAFASFETNRIYAPDVLDIEDLWQWESLGSGVSKTKPFTLEGLDSSSPESARLVVFLQGGSDADSVVDHHVEVFVNGALVVEESFDGAVPHRVTADLPVSLLAVANDLTVLNVGDTGVASRVFLDRFEVLYPQLPAARSGAFDGVFSTAGTASVTGISPAALLDLTTSASWITGYQAAPSLRFRAQAGHRYLAVSQGALLAPRVFFPEPSARLRSTQNQADYVLVAPSAFLDAARPLLERRQAQGLSTFAASLEEITSSFGGGQPTAEAIRDFLSFAYHQWRRPSPRYVLLLGDSNYDPRRFNPASQVSPMPFLLQKTSYIWTVSDPALADLNGDDALPDLAIGRLPATTVEQAQTMVAKVLDWEAQGQNLDGPAAIVADNPDIAGDFEAEARDIETSFLSGRPTTEIFLGQIGDRDVARTQILDAFNSGLSLISYVGHGGGAVWAGENILNSADPTSLLAQPRQPFMLTMNCLNGYFIAPFYESLAEGFLKAQGKGTIAAFSPSGLSLDGPAHLYHRALMQEITAGQHQRLGDAVLAAQKAYAESGAFPELLGVYHLFGDPAMRTR